MKIIKLLVLFLYSVSPVLLCANVNHVSGTSKMKNYLYDSNHVRYELYQTNEGKPYNWLFFPGGPGADSSYLRSLVDELKLPGNVWLIDLPGNGSNLQDAPQDNFDSWI